MVKRRRSPYRHRVRAHKRKGKPVKSFLRGKGAPRQRRKFKHVDGWVPRKVVVRKPPKKPPVVKKPRKPRKPRKKRPPKVIPKVLTPEDKKRRKELLDELEVHKANSHRARSAYEKARTFAAKTRLYKKYLDLVKPYNDTIAEINKLYRRIGIGEYAPSSPIPLREMQKMWRRKK